MTEQRITSMHEMIARLETLDDDALETALRRITPTPARPHYAESFPDFYRLAQAAHAEHPEQPELGRFLHRAPLLHSVHVSDFFPTLPELYGTRSSIRNLSFAAQEPTDLFPISHDARGTWHTLMIDWIERGGIERANRGHYLR